MSAVKGVLLTLAFVLLATAPLVSCSSGEQRATSASNSLPWTRQFGAKDDDYARSVAVDASGNIYVAGMTEGALPGQTSAGGMDVFIVKFTDAP